MKYLIYIFLFCNGLALNTSAQTLDTIPESFIPDVAVDTTFSDTILVEDRKNNSASQIVMSPDSLDAVVEYGSLDSNYLDNKEHKVHLFGEAYVHYKDLSLKADYIVVDLDSSIATAQGLPDSLGNIVGNPEFKMGEESFTAHKMRYNFVTRKGIITDALTQEGDLHIHGERTKFIAANPNVEADDDVLYAYRSLITTCDHTTPHFGIRARKVKTVPDKLAVIGSSNLELFSVPTPLWLPFGFYPVSENRAAGLILPRDYERSETWGLGIRDIGYYFPVSDWADVRLLADIYFNGTWGVGVVTNYAQKYKFRGNLAVRYSYRLSEIPNDYRNQIAKSFSVRLTHTQDAKSNPYQTLGGSINIQSNNFESLNYNDAQSALTNTYSSNFNYSRTFPGKPYALTAAFNHSQNTQSHLVTINAPELNFRVNRIYPFKNSRKPGPEQWYEKITFQYAGNTTSQITSTDTTLFDAQTWENAQFGAQHRANTSANINVAKYFNVTPSIDYSETWFFKTQDRMFKFDPNDMDFVESDTVFYPNGEVAYIEKDTIKYGEVNSSLTPGFDVFRRVSGSINMNTQMFSTLQFKKGWLRGLRHVVKPSFGYAFSPASPQSYYQDVQFSVLYPDSTISVSRFDNLLYSVRPTNVRNSNLTYSFLNIFEAKYFSKKDSTEKKLKLFDNISVGGSYNMAAERNKFTPLAISGNTRFFKGITTLSVSAAYSFYGLEKDGSLSEEFYIKTDNKLFRFDFFRLRLSTRITFSDIKSIFKSGTVTPPPPREGTYRDQSSKFEELLSGFNINHEFGAVRVGMSGPDVTMVTTNSINMTGGMKLTPNWSIYFGNIGYDFISKRITYPDIGLSRDLHCWQMSFNWQPTRGTYAFNINVKPGTFDFLKVPYKRGNYDASGGF